jgi:hypothetical protein
MATFTVLSAWDSLQDRTSANEIVLAYSERRQCVGDSAVGALASGGNAQDTAFWKGMQDWCESKCTRWVEDQSLSTSTEYETPNVIAYTLSTWRTAAGIPSGFRRATTWPTDWTDYADAAYSYGPIQAGDIRGPWIFADLQKAFNAMRWTYISEFSAKYPSDSPVTTTLSSDEFKYAVLLPTSGDSEAEAYETIETEWLEKTWKSGASANYIAAYLVEAGGLSYIDRQRASTVYENIPDHIAHTGSGYYHTHNSLYFDDFPFYDFDSLGLSDKKLTLKDTFSSATTDTRTMASIARIETAPPYQGVAVGEADAVFLLILKWQFSNTL